MKISGVLRFVVLTAILSANINSAKAVSEKEMDQARAIAATQYLRFANNGSGYLDGFTPASMADLEAKISGNTKEEENIKAFKAAGVPSGYSSWDKDRLVEYWSATFFNEKGGSLIQESANNQLARARIKNGLQAMKVVAPTAPAEPAVAPEAETSPAMTENPAREMQEIQDEIAETQEAIDNEAEEEPLALPEKKSSGTWVYIMILCILVAVVIVLVAYASKTMKAQNRVQQRKEREDREESRESAEAVTSLRRQLDSLEDENQSLRREVKELREKLRAESAERARLEEAAERAIFAGSRERREDRREEPREERRGRDTVIYLGRVNERGVFVRADRNLNPGNSVYRLVTTNGLTGTFFVVDDPRSTDVALEDPARWLTGGCAAKDIYDTDGKGYIYTEAPGTAIFEEGTWRVLRKAKIRYE